MGVVFEANHLEPNRHVSLKMIRGESQPRARLVARFRTEAVARIRHPNVLQIYNIGEAGALLFVVRELLEGAAWVIVSRASLNPRCGWPSWR